MLKEKTVLLFSLLLIFLGALSSRMIISQFKPGEFDTIAVNRIVKDAEKNWGAFAANRSPQPFPYSILNTNGTLLYQSDADTSVSINEAVKHHHLILDAFAGTSYLGKVLINTGQQDYLQAVLVRISRITVFCFCLLALMTLLFFYYLNQKLIKPFNRMKTFALNIAAGNLDMPLAMDKTNLFGPFTESFDIMREELAKARHQEAMANKSKKELVASLSHDVKTPLTSIKLVSELLEVTAADQKSRDKLHTIYQKADQIDQLITNLFHASLEELGQLSVAPAETESKKLREMIEQADLYNQTSVTEIPDCLLRIDPLRMQQIFDNLINNSIKYAGTAIDIKCTLSGVSRISDVSGEWLRVIVKDYGPGIPNDELPLVFQKYYRGSKAVDEQKDGSGIGLYLCHYLIEQMGGSIRCFNHEKGFAVELLLPLA